jgi:dihydroflavonol-4-reductase
MTPTRMVVTGAAGFIGRHLTQRLAADGAEVVALDVQPRPPQLAHPRIRFEALDIREEAGLARELEGADTVFHLASVHLSVHADPEEFRAVNVEAARRLVELCAAAGVKRLVHTSSVGIYGHVSEPPAAEESAKDPRSLYERTKLAGEEAVAQRAHELGQDVVVLRPAWVYGPGCPRTEKLFRALRKGRFFYVGGGTNLRHPIYIDEMVEAFRLAAAAPGSTTPRCYIVAGPRPVRLRELVEGFAAAAGVEAPTLSLPRPAAVAAGLMAELAFKPLRREPPFSRRSLAFFENDNAFTTASIQRDLGFVPRIDLEEGLRLTLQDTSWRGAA